MALRGGHTGFFHHGPGRTPGVDQNIPLDPYPFTWIWNVYILNAVPGGDYATFFAMGPNSFTGIDYYTAAVVSGGHPANTLSVGADGADNVGPTTSAPVGRWMRQALVCYRTGGSTYHDFYWDLPVFSRKLQSVVASTSYFSATTSAMFFRFGDVAWSPNESLDARFFGMKAFNKRLSPQACAAESLSPYLQMQEHAPALWGCWPGFKPATVGTPAAGGLMVPDISGNGRHLYTAISPDPGTPMTYAPDPPFITSGLGVPAFDYSPELLATAPASASASNFFPFGDSF